MLDGDVVLPELQEVICVLSWDTQLFLMLFEKELSQPIDHFGRSIWWVFVGHGHCGIRLVEGIEVVVLLVVRVAGLVVIVRFALLDCLHVGARSLTVLCVASLLQDTIRLAALVALHRLALLHHFLNFQIKLYYKFGSKILNYNFI